jgi:hypothetical protein
MNTLPIFIGHGTVKVKGKAVATVSRVADGVNGQWRLYTRIQAPNVRSGIRFFSHISQLRAYIKTNYPGSIMPYGRVEVTSARRAA